MNKQLLASGIALSTIGIVCWLNLFTIFPIMPVTVSHQVRTCEFWYTPYGSNQQQCYQWITNTVIDSFTPDANASIRQVFQIVFEVFLFGGIGMAVYSPVSGREKQDTAQSGVGTPYTSVSAPPAPSPPTPVASVQTISCVRCGTEIPREAAHCPNCGIPNFNDNFVRAERAESTFRAGVIRVY